MTRRVAPPAVPFIGAVLFGWLVLFAGPVPDARANDDSASVGSESVRLFRADSADALARGAREDLSLDADGTLALAARVEAVARIDEPFAFATVGLRDGWAVGTGNAGRVLHVAPDGAVKVLFTASEPEIFALAADARAPASGAVAAADARTDTLWVGSSPGGRVYRIDLGDGTVEPFFEPDGATYIWALARDRRGRLLVGTGLPGRLYRVSKDGKAELLLDGVDRHVRALTPLADGGVLVGTAGQGRILMLDEDGRVRTLYDAAHPEIVAFAAVPKRDAADAAAGEGADASGGGVLAYAAALASEASYVDLSGTNGAAAAVAAAAGSPAVTVDANGGDTIGSRGAGFTGPRSVLLEIDRDGSVREVWTADDATVHSLLWHDEALWVGTGPEGRLHRRTDGRMVIERSLAARQVTAMANGIGDLGPALVTANGAGLSTLPGGTERRGVYTSAVLDAQQVARFGVLHWRGALPEGASLQVEVRSGLSAQPDATWTPWVDAAPLGDGVDARTIALSALSAGRYIQWRATFEARERGRARGPRVTAVELSYRQENLRPRIARFEVLDPGQVLVPQTFNPLSQTFEPWSPNRDG
ncbi:MAG: hypothetical protein AAF772_19370, partial [Acidobacteriota bacterium]